MPARRFPSRGGRGHSSASGRVGDEIRMKVSELLQREVRDARLAGVHLTRVELSRDMGRALLYWRPTPGGASEADATEALEKASSFLRSRMGRTLRVKSVPELAFSLDELPSEGSRIDELLAGLSAPVTKPIEGDAPIGSDDDEE